MADDDDVVVRWVERKAKTERVCECYTHARLNILHHRSSLPPPQSLILFSYIDDEKKEGRERFYWSVIFLSNFSSQMNFFLLSCSSISHFSFFIKKWKNKSKIFFIIIKIFILKLNWNQDASEYQCESGEAPRYVPHKPITGVIGASFSTESIMVANILRLFKVNLKIYFLSWWWMMNDELCVYGKNGCWHAHPKDGTMVEFHFSLFYYIFKNPNSFV